MSWYFRIQITYWAEEKESEVAPSEEVRGASGHDIKWRGHKVYGWRNSTKKQGKILFVIYFGTYWVLWRNIRPLAQGYRRCFRVQNFPRTQFVLSKISPETPLYFHFSLSRGPTVHQALLVSFSLEVRSLHPCSDRILAWEEIVSKQYPHKQGWLDLSNPKKPGWVFSKYTLISRTLGRYLLFFLNFRIKY